MSKPELPKAYEPKGVEDAIYTAWEKSGAFNPDNLEGEPFSLMMPPPNVTGVLHLGHALENTLMDSAIRYQRMKGRKTLLLAGTDHAAVATQARVEKNLMKEGIKNPREELGREKLLEKIRAYAEESKSTILTQIKKMGTSADWSRLAYTFDDDRSRAVNEIFARMYKDGLIYRGHRVVNWSVKGQSTCSDDELVHVERKAKLYTFTYSKDFPITIATTRPETKLGDTAVAVNPKDKRYKEYIGKTFDVNFCGVDLKIKVIADDHVDAKFGTGALGVTPAHSPIDFEMYEKQKAAGDEIGLIQVIGEDGKMTAEAGSDFAGLTVEEAREKIVEKLEKAGLLQGEEEIDQNVGTSDRFGDVVEALPMTQWFVAVNREIPGRGKTLKQLMQEAVRVGHGGDKEKKVRITPKRFEKSYYGWIDNLRDWCISRQIWWGHRIPVWYKGDEIAVGEAPADDWEQDPDTLDTWFSSGTWTFSTLGWPDETEDLKTFHTTTWMQMGYEILFFWMARMILMSTYALDEIPFRDVYIHGMLRDKSGQKFSKSLGNGIDPLEVIDRYGADALRFSLVAGISPGNDSRFYEEKVESAAHLVNKLWNISRFAMMNVEEVVVAQQLKPETMAQKWILGRFAQLVKEVTRHLDRYEFSQAAEKLRQFTWSEFADWYLEMAKVKDQRSDVSDQVLLYILERLLKLWHPLMPFVTEELYKSFDAGMLMTASWPTADHKKNKDASEAIEQLQEIVTFVRDVRARYDVSRKDELSVTVVGMKPARLEELTPLIVQLGGACKIASEGRPEVSTSAVIGKLSVHVDLAGLIDVDKERARLQKDLDETTKYVTSLEGRLSGSFAKKAPKEIVDGEKEKLAAAKEKAAKLEEELASLA